MEDKPKRFRRYPKFGVISDTPLSAIVTPPNPYASIAATTPRLRVLNFHYEKEIDPIRLKSGGIIQPSLLRGSVAERIEIDVTPKTAGILGTYDYPITVGKARHPRTQVGVLIRDTDSPKVSHLSSLYPGRGLRQEMIYDLTKRQGSILIHTPTPKAYEPMGAEYTNVADMNAAKVGFSQGYLASRGGKIPMKLTRAGFEASHISKEEPGDEGGLNPREMPSHELTAKEVPHEYGWERHVTKELGQNITYTTKPGLRAHPAKHLRFYQSKPEQVTIRPQPTIKEEFIPPSEEEERALLESAQPRLPPYTSVEQEEADKEITDWGLYEVAERPPKKSDRRIIVEDNAGTEEQIDEELESLYGKD